MPILTLQIARGFNTLWIELLCDSYTFGYGNGGTVNYGRDINGNNPFVSTLSGGYYDLTTPNNAYRSHVDYIVQTAAANGLQCLFTPLDQGGWSNTASVNGNARLFQYGQFLGNRYKNYPNIIWNMGNDFQNWREPQADGYILSIADGIKSVDTVHPMTIELDYFVSESQDETNWIPRINTNGVYTVLPDLCGNAGCVQQAYDYAGVFRRELRGREQRGRAGTPKVLRRKEYWSMGGGALAGHLYGSIGWTGLPRAGNAPELTAVTVLGYFKNFFNSIHWYDLCRTNRTHS